MISSCQQALKAIVALDATGLILGWRFFDHAAHLGGALFGMWVTRQCLADFERNNDPIAAIYSVETKHSFVIN